MEKLGNMLAIWFHGQRSMLKKANSKLNHLSLNGLSILIILFFGVFPLTAYFIFSGAHYSLQQILASYLLVILLFTLVLIVVIGWFKARELEKSNAHGFTFKKLSIKKLDKEYFGFDDMDVANLESLMNLLPFQEKIVIREVPKNKQSGNLRFLFTFLDLIVKDGILELGTESREALLTLLQSKFTFEHGEVNNNTFTSSYSKWSQKTKDGDYDDLRKRMAMALGFSQ